MVPSWLVQEAPGGEVRPEQRFANGQKVWLSLPFLNASDRDRAVDVLRCCCLLLVTVFDTIKHPFKQPFVVLLGFFESSSKS